MPEPVLSKIMRSVAKVGAQITKKFVRDSGLVDENTANIVEGVAGGVQNQAEASRDASVTDRLKMAGKVFIYIYTQCSAQDI